MSISFLEHARERMEQRGVSELDVVWALSEPDRVNIQSNGRFKAARQKDGKLSIVVVYERSADASDSILVVTAYRERSR